MPGLDESRAALLAALLDRYGDPPKPVVGLLEAAHPFESIVAVALELVTDPRTASAALDALRQGGLLQAHALAEANPLEIDELFRSRKIRLAAKALRPIQRIARWAFNRGFDLDQAASVPTESLREEWLTLNGIGPATADALLLLALGRPAYPVDRATYRVLVRHGWLDPSSDYDEARSVAESLAPDDPGSLAQLSRLLIRLGRDCCTSSRARCERCPLQAMLPPGGPVEAGE